MKKLSIIIICIAMALMFAVVSPLQLAAGSKVKYISDIVIAYGEDEKQAAINAGYTNATDNVNKGNSVAVYLCYKYTYDKKQAIYDLSLMSMNGNYSYAKFEDMLASKKEQVAGMLYNMQTAIKEFTVNYNAGTYAATTAYKTLNLFTDDDTGKGLGDLFVGGITDEALQTILIQANTKLLSSVMMALSIGCSYNVTYGTLLDKVATLSIDDEYDESLYSACVKLADEFEMINESLSAFENAWAVAADYYVSNNVIGTADAMTEEQFGSYIAKFDAEYSESISGITIGYGIYKVTRDVEYAHSGATVYDLLKTDYNEFKSDESYAMHMLAPLATAMTDGQFALVSTVGLFDIITQTCMTDTDMDDAYDDIYETIKETENETVSIYLGVDRTMYQNVSVALTTDASTETYANENYDWADGTKNAIDAAKTVQKVGQIIMVSLAGILVCSVIILSSIALFSKGVTTTLSTTLLNYFSIQTYLSGISAYGTSFTTKVFGLFFNGGTLLIMIAIVGVFMCLGAYIARLCIKSAAKKEFTGYTYTDIPEILIDFIDDDTINSEFVFYYPVTRADGTPGDLNGWDNMTNKYWNALYYSKDSRLGDPITEGFLLSTSNIAPDGMVGVHDFEKGVEGVKAAVNLNQSSKAQDTAIYMYYKTGSGNSQTGSVFSSGSGIASLIGAFVLGLAISGGTVYAMTKKKKAEENA